MKDSFYQMNYKKKYEQLTRELKYELSQFINFYSTSSNFDTAETKCFLKQFYESKNRFIMLDKLVSVKNNQYKDLEQMCNQTLKIVNSYTSNGKILYLSIGFAVDFAKKSNTNREDLFEKSTEKPAVKLFPVLAELSDTEYATLTQQSSGYAKSALKKISF